MSDIGPSKKSSARIRVVPSRGATISGPDAPHGVGVAQTLPPPPPAASSAPDVAPPVFVAPPAVVAPPVSVAPPVVVAPPAVEPPAVKPCIIKIRRRPANVAGINEAGGTCPSAPDPAAPEPAASSRLGNPKPPSTRTSPRNPARGVATAMPPAAAHGRGSTSSMCLRKTPARLAREQVGPVECNKVKNIFGDANWKGLGKYVEGEQKLATVALISDEDMLLHESDDPLQNESPERLLSIMSKLREHKLLDRCDLFKPDEIGVKYLIDVHPSNHVNDILSIAKIDQNERNLLALQHCNDGDIYYSQASTRAALLAAGGSVKGCTLVTEGMYKYAFALVRPPGHHAGLSGPTGFCLFNNIAIGAKHLLNKYKLKRVVILDWDVHHGDGSQKIFYKDSRVLFISVHRYGSGFYPSESKGGAKHIGKKNGKGFNANLCFTHEGIRDVDYLTVWEYFVIPIITEFDPEIILISAGYDAADGDKLGECKVTPNGFAMLLQMLKKFGRIVLVLEGGYNLQALSESVSACIQVLLGDDSCIPLDKTILPYDTTWKAIMESRKRLKPFWDVFKKDIPEAITSESILYRDEDAVN